jgi:FkbM family methyltransferase
MKPHKISPKQITALQNAINLHNQGQLDQADEVYRKFLREVPNHPDALHLRALVAHARGHFADAAKFAEAAIAIAPGIANFHNTAGDAWRRQQQTRQALRRLTEAIRLDPASAMAHHNLSLALCDEARYAEALESCRMALSLNPSYLEARIAVVDILALLGDLVAAEPEAAVLARYRDNRAACDALAKYHTRRARAHLAQLQFAEGRAQARSAVSASPWFWGGWAILGEVSNELFERDSAELYCCIAANLAPDNKDARLNLAHLLREQQRLQEAGSHYDAWLKDHADDGNAHFGLAVAHLGRGNYVEGWREYEYRWAVAGARQKFADAPAWAGQPGKLLVYPEQGLGDFLQMLRFIPEAARRCNAELTVLTPAPLLRLVRRQLAAIASVMVTSELAPGSSFDYACPVMSLPHVLDIDSAQKIASPLPYLSADSPRQREFESILSRLPGKKLGVVWRGAADNALNRRRALPEQALQPLLALAGWTPVSLQFGVKDPVIGEHRLVDLSEHIQDFEDLAAAMQSMDAVVSLDTGPAHLAGAMNLACYTLVPCLHDWRWGTHGTRCDWYPSLTLIRQVDPASWDAPIQTLVGTLRGEAAAPSIEAARNRASIEQSTFPFVRVRARHGTFAAPLFDQRITRSLLLYGEYSPRAAALLASLLRPGDTAVDVGANIGALTLPMASAVGQEGRVIAFEQQRILHRSLSEALACNQMQQVDARHLAVGSNAGHTMVADIDAAQPADMRALSTNEQTGGEQVEVIALDSLDLASCRLVKIDAAGREKEVLEGAGKLIARCKPVLYVQADKPGAVDRIAALLRGWGYRLFQHQAPLFSADNYRSCEHDVFPGMVSLNLLALPAGVTPPADVAPL